MNSIKEIKQYIEENSIEFEDIDFGENEISDIRSDPIKLANFYIKYFNEFSNSMKNCKHKNVSALLSDKDIFISLIKLSGYKSKTSEFGRSIYQKRLSNYVLDNYEKIIWFFDMFNEVSG